MPGSAEVAGMKPTASNTTLASPVASFWMLSSSIRPPFQKVKVPISTQVSWPPLRVFWLMLQWDLEVGVPG